MARTLLGQLVLMLQDKASGPAKTAASSIDGSLAKIEAAQKRLASAPWGVGTQKQLQALKLTSSEFATVQSSWDRLQAHLRTNNLSKSLSTQQVSAWRSATVGAFAAARAEAAATTRQVGLLNRAFGGLRDFAGKAALVSMGAYTGAYLGGVAIRGGIGSWADQRRELFRQEMAGISPLERAQILQRSMSLSSQYASVGTTEAMELARTSRNLMGGTDRGNEVLETMVKGLVTLQSSKGTDSGTSEMMRLQKGLDNLGVNAGGEIGIKNVRNVIEGFVRASQIEGMDLDVGSFWQFARRTKVAGSALSTDFLTKMAPILMQDMGADTAGNAIAMAFKAFLIGANDTASKVNLQYQKDLGLRTGAGKGELVGGQLFSENPYLWTKKHLIPALTKAGVDITNESEVSVALAKMSKNSNATSFLTRLILQQEQYEKSLALIERTQGLDAADEARRKDPYLALQAFTRSFGNLAAAIGGEGSTVLGFLNGAADAVNVLAAAVQNNPALQNAIGTAAVAGGGAAAIATGISLYKFLRAGPELSAAATQLQGAAAALRGAAAGQGVGGGISGGGGKTVSVFSRDLLRIPLAISALNVGMMVVDDLLDKRTTEQKIQDARERGQAINKWLDKNMPFMNPRKYFGLDKFTDYIDRRPSPGALGGKDDTAFDRNKPDQELSEIHRQILRNAEGPVSVAPIPAGRGGHPYGTGVPMAQPAPTPRPVIEPVPTPRPERVPALTIEDAGAPVVSAAPKTETMVIQQPTPEVVPSVSSIPVPVPRPDFSEVKAEAEAAGQAVQAALNVAAQPKVDKSEIDDAVSHSAKSGQEIEKSLSVTALPKVDKGDIDDAVSHSQRSGQAIKSSLDISAQPKVNTGDVTRATEVARAAGTEMLSALNIYAIPTVNVTSLERALSLAQQLRSVLSGIGAEAQAAGNRAARQIQSHTNELYADTGVIAP